MEATKRRRYAMSGRAFTLVLLAALLPGCAPVGPNYQQPNLAPPGSFRFAEQTSQAASIADAPWFQVFDDPALQALIKEAINNNLDLKVAVSRLEEARARA